MKEGYRLADGTYSTDYTEGDKFVVVNNVESCDETEVGMTITLTCADGTQAPLFQSPSGNTLCCVWKELKKFNKEELDMNILQKKIEEMKQKIAELESLVNNQQEKAEVKQWEPVGGEWYIDYSSDVGEAPSSEECRKFGMERPTEEQAQKARDEMRVYHRLLAYVHEHAPDYVFDKDGCNCYVELYSEDDSPEYEIGYDNEYKRVGQVYMPEDVAEELCRKLKSGEVVL